MPSRTLPSSNDALWLQNLLQNSLATESMPWSGSWIFLRVEIVVAAPRVLPAPKVGRSEVPLVVGVVE